MTKYTIVSSHINKDVVMEDPKFISYFDPRSTRTIDAKGIIEQDMINKTIFDALLLLHKMTTASRPRYK